MTLGTVQLGLPYGVANRTGQPTEEESVALLRAAFTLGVNSLDCARGYGVAEARVGLALRETEGIHVVTKLDPLAALSDEADLETVKAAVRESVIRSSQALGLPRLPVVLLHRWSHRRSHGKAIWNELLDLKRSGLIRRLGASVYAPEEALEALRDPDIEHLQIPFNVLDWRWKAASVNVAAQQKPGVVIHARSALLQGLLASTSSTWPRIDGVDPGYWLERLDRYVAAWRRKSRADLCLAYVRSQPWIASTVVGVETMEQLTENVALFQSPPLTPVQCRQLEESLTGAPEALLNPSLWPPGPR